MTGKSEDSWFYSTPMMVTTREYYKDTGTGPPSPFPATHQTPHPEAHGLSTGRRHSVVDGHLYRQMLDWNLKSAPNSRRGSSVQQNIKIEPKDESSSSSPILSSTDSLVSHTSPLSSDSSTGSQTPPLVEQRIFNPLDPRYLGGIPYTFTTTKLRELGGNFLGKRETADAFVRAIPITSRRSSGKRPYSFPPRGGITITPRASTPPSPKAAAGCIVRVKIVPKLPERKSFIMQKRFPTHRHHHCRGLLQPVLNDSIGKLCSRKTSDKCLPIHVEYVAYRTPLLAAILLSGHVRKGDTLEIPMPYPDKWPRVVEWIYTGSIGNISPEEKDVIEYLGGQID